MRIGFDFDNTIVSYDSLFHKVALEQSLIPPEIPVSKVSVRNYLRETDREHIWTEMQGYVYGSRMSEAEPYRGAIAFIKLAISRGEDVFIVSHKTKYPFLGPKYDLHEAATKWIGEMLSGNEGPLFTQDRIFFELTKEAKIARIASNAFDFFIDDLPEILLMDGFPECTKGMLFDPESAHSGDGTYSKFRSWQEIQSFFEERWYKPN